MRDLTAICAREAACARDSDKFFSDTGQQSIDCIIFDFQPEPIQLRREIAVCRESGGGGGHAAARRHLTLRHRCVICFHRVTDPMPKGMGCRGSLNTGAQIPHCSVRIKQTLTGYTFLCRVCGLRLRRVAGHRQVQRRLQRLPTVRGRHWIHWTGEEPEHNFDKRVVEFASMKILQPDSFLLIFSVLSIHLQVCMIGDSVGSILAYDSLCKNNPFLYSRGSSRYGSHTSLNETEDSENDAQLNTAKKHTAELTETYHVSKKTNLETIRQVSFSNPDIPNVNCNDISGKSAIPQGISIPADQQHQRERKLHSDVQRTASGGGGGGSSGSGGQHAAVTRSASSSGSRRASAASQTGGADLGKLDFDVSDLFMFGSPLPLVLAYRKICQQEDKSSEFVAVSVFH